MGGGYSDSNSRPTKSILKRAKKASLDRESVQFYESQERHDENILKSLEATQSFLSKYRHSIGIPDA
jgi:hypothetical protein